jgi:hypothetical protein
MLHTAFVTKQFRLCRLNAVAGKRCQEFCFAKQIRYVVQRLDGVSANGITWMGYYFVVVCNGLGIANLKWK